MSARALKYSTGAYKHGSRQSGLNTVCSHIHSCLTISDSMDYSRQAPLSMGFARQEYRSGLPFPSPGDLLDSGIKSTSPVSPALAGRYFTTEPPGKPTMVINKTGSILQRMEQSTERSVRHVHVYVYQVIFQQ